MCVLQGLSGPQPGHNAAACPTWPHWGCGAGAEGTGMGQGLPATHLVVDVLSGWRAARGQDVIVVAVVDDQDAPGPHHAGNVPQGQLVVTLVPWRGNYGVSRHRLYPTVPSSYPYARTHAHPDICPYHLPPNLSLENPQPHPWHELRHVLSLTGAEHATWETHHPTLWHKSGCASSLVRPVALMHKPPP